MERAGQRRIVLAFVKRLWLCNSSPVLEILGSPFCKMGPGVKLHTSPPDGSGSGGAPGATTSPPSRCAKNWVLALSSQAYKFALTSVFLALFPVATDLL